jgi:TonB-linked SusC/RagA family outer membrane protein
MKKSHQNLFRKLCLTIASILMVSAIWAQQSITGTVVDDKGELLPGVSVIIQGTASGTVTGADGKFSLTVPSDGVLVFSFVGMTTVTEQVNGRTSINVTMSESSIGIEEVVAVGYGTMKKSDLTGSVMSVNSSQFEDQPMTKMDQALQGRAAGVQVNQTSGSPGAVMKIRIRGANSISGNNDPLYIMDGMVISDIGSINVNDIESLEVLKDASATAIYGSRGANGVILITTKTGKKGRPTIMFDSYFGVSNVFQELPMMSAAHFAEGVNYDQGPGKEKYTPEEIAALEQNGGVDWQKELFKSAPSSNYQLSFSGGGDATDYFISGNIYNAEGTIINQEYKRYTVRANVNTKLSDKIKIGINVSGSREEANGARADLSEGLTFDPTTPVYDENGDYNFASIKGVGNGGRNPVIGPNEIIVDNYENRLNTSGYFNLEIIKNLELNISGGVNYLNRDNNRYEPITINSRGIAQIDLTTSSLLQNTNRITYKLDNKGKHNAQFDLIHEQQLASNKFMNTDAYDFFSDGTTYKDMALGQLQVIANGETSSSLQSFLGRANYSYDDKYLLTASLRADGSSKFREGQQWGYFPSASVAWRISQENFMKDVEQVTNLKLRASYGITGSQAIGALATRSRPVIALINNYPFTGDVATVGAAPSNRMANPDLTWEETSQINFGFDLGLWQNKLTFSFDTYKKTTSNLLLDRFLPEFVGPTVMAQNVGKMENKGFEFVLGFTALETKDWSITSTITFNHNKNTVLELVDDKPIEKGNVYMDNTFPVNPTRLEVGLPMGSFRGYVFEGVYQLGEEEAAAKYGRKPGDARYADISGPDGVPDGLISSDDITIVGDGNPNFTFGWNGAVSYKNLDLNFLFTGSVGNDIYNFQRGRMMSLGARTFNATHLDYENRWSPENPSNIPSGRNGTELLSSQFIEDGSYLALKNVNLGYSFKNVAFFNAIGLDALKIYGSIENAFILTKYTGFDPESTASGNSDVDLGIDLNTYPLSRTFIAGIKFTF